MDVSRVTRDVPPSLSDRYSVQLVAVLVVVGIVQILELFLLQQKYDLFTSGFLQPHSYLTWPDRAGFIGISVWIDVVFFGVIGLFWFFVSQRFNVRPLLAVYNYFFVTLSFMGIWLALKFKTLSYFNDTLNFLVIKNLGGGSLLEAVSYVVSEGAILGIWLLCLVCLYLAGLYWANRNSGSALVNTQAISYKLKSIGWWLGGIGLLTIALMVYINSDFSLRYGLKKKTSYALTSNLLDHLTDLDRDGYGLFVFPTDPEIFNSEIFPGALDFPGNGLDEDGYAGDFKWDGPEADPLELLAPMPGKHILLVVLESARGDLLGKVWRGQPVAPTITSMAQAGTNVEYAYSHTGYTVSSINALLNRTLSSRQDRVALTDFLRRSGYSLSFISGQDESFGGIATSTGMNEPGNYLFDARSALKDRVFASKEPGSLRLSEDRVVQQFNVRAEEVDWKKPQFFYLNLQAAHFPYSHPNMPMPINPRPINRSDISERNLTSLQATYWNAIAVADQAIASMIERLKQLGVYKDTVIAVVGDHGESLFEDHFLGHGHALNEAQTRIPLVINQPGLNINGAVGQKDVAELLVMAATDRIDKYGWGKQEPPQLQIVGSLNQPQLVGTVSTGAVRTILDLGTRKVFFNDLRRWEDFDKAINDSRLGERTKKLIELWEGARWEDYLSRSKAQINTPDS